MEFLFHPLTYKKYLAPIRSFHIESLLNRFYSLILLQAFLLAVNTFYMDLYIVSQLSVVVHAQLRFHPP